MNLKFRMRMIDLETRPVWPPLRATPSSKQGRNRDWLRGRCETVRHCYHETLSKAMFTARDISPVARMLIQMLHDSYCAIVDMLLFCTKKAVSFHKCMDLFKSDQRRRLPIVAELK